MTINDQIRETSVRVNVRVLLATSDAAAGPTCACVCMRIRLGLYVRIHDTVKDRAGYIADVGGAP